MNDTKQHHANAAGNAERAGILAGESPLMSAVDVGRILKVHSSVVRDLCRRGELPSVKIGRRVFVPRDELESQIERDMRGKGARHE